MKINFFGKNSPWWNRFFGIVAKSMATLMVLVSGAPDQYISKEKKDLFAFLAPYILLALAAVVQFTSDDKTTPPDGQ